jgi:hypothetical protein
MAFSGLGQRPIFICDNERLVAEASSSVFAQRNHISPAGIRHLWNGLSNFINVSLKSHKVCRPGTDAASLLGTAVQQHN